MTITLIACVHRVKTQGKSRTSQALFPSEIISHFRECHLEIANAEDRFVSDDEKRIPVFYILTL